MSNAIKVILLIVLVAVVIFVVWKVVGGVKETAELTARASPVKRLEGSTHSVESVSVGTKRTMYQGDGVNVDQQGRAQLKIAGCSLDIFQGSGLQWTPSTASAPVCTVDMSHGTLVASVDKDMALNTEWCVIRTLGTRFIVHVDPDRGLLWIIVREGKVEVIAGSNRAVVGPGWQTWVRRDGQIAPLRPANRGEVGELFPRLEELTNNALRDGEWLGESVATEPPPPATLEIALEQSTDQVVVGDCEGEHTVFITAYLEGPEEVIAEVDFATLRYRWEGGDPQVVGMERADDFTFVGEIAPFDYCCEEAIMEYEVEVTSRSKERMAAAAGKVLLVWCMG
jgi:hypothetical protein